MAWLATAATLAAAVRIGATALIVALLLAGAIAPEAGAACLAALGLKL